MSDLNERLADLLVQLTDEAGVPGAQVALLTPDGTFEASTGVLSLATGVEATTDAVFQLGSITKVFTATLVLQLVDEGIVDLDVPVVTYLPEVVLPDLRVTTRQLLDHSNGIDGDLFLDTGRGDDAVARYVAAMADLGSVAPLGECFNYSNAAYTLLGHLVATLRGQVWEDVLRSRLLQPLGMTTSGTLAEEALLHRAAVGHVADGEGLRPASVWAPDRSAGPAGRIHASARDVLAFAQLHLSGGLAPDGTRLLSAASVAAMQQASTPTRDGRAVGLGWFLDDWAQPVYFHDGGTIGQLAFLRVLPESGTAIALGTNGPAGAAVFAGLVTELVPELTGAVLPQRAVPSGGPVPPDAADWVGTYESVGARYDVELRDGRLSLRSTSRLPETITQAEPAAHLDLLHVRDSSYVGQLDGKGPWVPVDFLTFSDGSSAVALGSRVTPRV